jgi:hypothetical protein
VFWGDERFSWPGNLKSSTERAKRAPVASEASTADRPPPGDGPRIKHVDSCRLAPQTNSLAKLWTGPRLVAGKYGVGNFTSGQCSQRKNRLASLNGRIVKAKAIVLHILPGLHATKLRQRKLHLALLNAKFALTGTLHFPSHFPSNANFHCCVAALLLCCAATLLRCCFAALLRFCAVALLRCFFAALLLLHRFRPR